MGKNSRFHLSQTIGLGLLLLVIVGVGWAIYSMVALSSPPHPIALVPATPPQVILTGTPLDVFDAHHPPLTELSAWARQWEAGWGATSRPSNENELARLKTLIEKSGLDANDQLSVGDYILHKGDKDVATVWFRCAIPQTEREWKVATEQAGAGHEEEVAEKILRPLLPKGLDEAGRLFWEPDHLDGAMEEILSRMELGMAPKNLWDQRPKWVRIGHSEALMVMERYPEALAEADALNQELAQDEPHFTQHMKTEMHWDRGAILYGLKRYTEAATELEIVVADVKFEHTKDAWPLLIQSLCSINRGEEAEHAFNTYVQLYHPDASEVAMTSGLIVDAKYNEQHK